MSNSRIGYLLSKDLDDLEYEEQLELLGLLRAAKEYKRFNKLEFVTPYPYQMKFMNSSLTYPQRLMRAANRVGKSFGGALEFAQHITGKYQDYYKGKRIDGSGHIFWCIGIDLDTTANVLQRELIGTSDIRNENLIGTGAIPRDNIVLDGMVKDGNKVKSMLIRHEDGGVNTLQFYGSAQGQDKLMGQAVKLAWIDEEPSHNSLEIYSQVVTRTATTDGLVMVTFTPEQGYTALNKLFDESEELYVQSVSWEDCPHLDEETKVKLLAGIPEWQRDMRSKGLPVLGSGAVFSFKDSEISTTDVDIQPHWPIIAAVDFGKNVDPSTISFVAWDVDNDVVYMYDEAYLDDDRSAKAIADVIKNSKTPNIPVIVPHDGGLSDSAAPDTYGKQMRDIYGVNVFPTVFCNPPEVTLDATGKVDRRIEPGLVEMRRRFSDGSLKISTVCENWFREKNTYFYKPKGGRTDFGGDDHMIDSSRYAILSILGHKGMPYGQCISEQKWMNNGFYQNNSNNGFSY